MTQGAQRYSLTKKTEVENLVRLSLRPGYNTIWLKGTVSRYFWPLVYSPSNTPGSTDSWTKAVSNIDSYSRRYLTTKIANFQFYFTAMGCLWHSDVNYTAVQPTLWNIFEAICRKGFNPYFSGLVGVAWFLKMISGKSRVRVPLKQCICCDSAQ
jgi:hypothetical protein